MIASLVRDILCFTPLAVVLSLLLEKGQPGSGIYGILFAAPAADLVAVAVIIGLTVHFFEKLKKLENTPLV